MKLLLDENLPKKLKNDFPGHTVLTISEKKWLGKSNGELMQLMVAEKFDALLTFDKNLQHQQNFEKYPIAVLVLNARNNSYNVLRRLIPQVRTLLTSGIKVGPNEIKGE